MDKIKNDPTQYAAYLKKKADSMKTIRALRKGRTSAVQKRIEAQRKHNYRQKKIQREDATSNVFGNKQALAWQST